MDPVKEFIDRRFKADCNWLNGNCYYFALILSDRFPGGTVYYDVIYEDLSKYGIAHRIIAQKKARTRYTYDIDGFLLDDIWRKIDGD